MTSTISTNMSSTSTTTLQQLIYETLYRHATPIIGPTQEFATAEEARDAYITLVMSDLFPGYQSPAKMETVVEVPVSSETPKTKKPRTKKQPEPVASSESPKVAEAPAVAAEVPLPQSPKEKEKKKRGPMTEEAKAAMKAKREAKKADVNALTEGLAAMTLSEPNLKKMDPTWKKHLKAVAKAQSREVTKDLENDLLAFLNRLTKEEFANKKAEEHVTDFLKPQTGSNAAAEERTPTDLEIVEFNGVEYFVNPETKRVYEGVGQRDDDTGAYENYKPVGYVGMAAFEGMKLE